MTARELLAYVDRSGGRVWLEDDRLAYDLPHDRDDVLKALKAHRDRLVGFLEAQRPPENAELRLPAHLEPIVRAASTGVLPAGSVRLPNGEMIADLNTTVLVYTAVFILGDRQHALSRLEAARAAWDAIRGVH